MDKIGTLEFDIVVNLISVDLLTSFISSMDQILNTISDNVDIQYQRFSTLSATIQIKAPIHTFWKTDTIFNTFRDRLNKNFKFWRFKITLTINEKG